METFVSQCKAAFQEKFGSEARYCGVAPGRVNLIGEHTDYNEGFVFPMCMPMYTVAIGRKTDSGVVNVYSKTLDRGASFPVSNIEKTTDKELYWTNFVRGAIKIYSEKSGVELSGVELLIDTQVPLGGGLSSSASLGVAVITFCEAVTEQPIKTSEKALGAKWAENVFADSPCGIMDQWISAHGEKGKAMLLDCRDQSHKMFPVDSEELCFLVINSNVKHALVGSPYAERQSSCFTAAEIMKVKSLRGATMEMLKEHESSLTELQLKRARHAISEDVRTLSATEALVKGDFAKFGELMNASHNSLRDDFEVSIAELDQLVDIARSVKGVLGSRMTGGGFGGCTVTLVRRDSVENLQNEINQKYTGKASFYVATAAEGAKIIKL